MQLNDSHEETHNVLRRVKRAASYSSCSNPKLHNENFWISVIQGHTFAFNTHYRGQTPKSWGRKHRLCCLSILQRQPYFVLRVFKSRSSPSSSSNLLVRAREISVFASWLRALSLFGSSGSTAPSPGIQHRLHQCFIFYNISVNRWLTSD